MFLTCAVLCFIHGQPDESGPNSLLICRYVSCVVIQHAYSLYLSQSNVQSEGLIKAAA